MPNQVAFINLSLSDFLSIGRAEEREEIFLSTYQKKIAPCLRIKLACIIELNIVIVVFKWKKYTFQKKLVILLLKARATLLQSVQKAWF